MGDLGQTSYSFLYKYVHMYICSCLHIDMLSACMIQLMSVFRVVTRKMCDYSKTKIQVGCNKPTPTLAFGRCCV